MPLYTPRWGATPVVALVPHLFGGTAFQELAAAARRRGLARRSADSRASYRGVPFEAISESTADDLVERGIPRDRIRVIYPRHRHAALHARAELRGRRRRCSPISAGSSGTRASTLSFARSPRWPLPDATLEIAGAGDYRPGSSGSPHRLTSATRARFLGRISEEDKLALAPASVGARVRVAEGRLGHHESRGGGLRHAGRRLELARNPGVGARRRDGLPGAARRRRPRWPRRCGASPASPALVERSARRRDVRRGVHLGTRRRSRPRRIWPPSS